MIAKTIEFEDYNGVKRKEEHYFHLSKPEVMDWLLRDGEASMDQVLVNLIKSGRGNKKEFLDSFRDMIYRSYGRKSDDGRRFIKTDEVKSDFMETEAFNVLFEELLSSEEAATEFIIGILPKDLQDEVRNISDDDIKKLPKDLQDLATINKA